MKLSKAIELYHCLEYCKVGCNPKCSKYESCNNSNQCKLKLLDEIQNYLDEVIDYMEEEV